jgi:hypothetical protein
VNVPLLLPPPVRFNVPVCTLTVPVLLKATLLLIVVVPVPADLVNVPALVKVGGAVPIPHEKVASFWASKVAPAWLLNTLPLPPLIVPVPVQVAVPKLLRVRVSRVLVEVLLTLIAPPAAMVVAPAPLIVPPVQEKVPVAVRLPLPPSVPLLKVTVLEVAVLLKLAVPPVMVVEPVTL